MAENVTPTAARSERSSTVPGGIWSDFLVQT